MFFLFSPLFLRPFRPLADPIVASNIFSSYLIRKMSGMMNRPDASAEQRFSWKRGCSQNRANPDMLSGNVNERTNAWNETSDPSTAFCGKRLILKSFSRKIIVQTAAVTVIAAVAVLFSISSFNLVFIHHRLQGSNSWPKRKASKFRHLARKIRRKVSQPSVCDVDKFYL